MKRARLRKSKMIEVWWRICVDRRSQFGESREWGEAINTDTLFDLWQAWARNNAPWYADEVSKGGFMIMLHRVAKARILHAKTVRVGGKREQVVTFGPLEKGPVNV